MSTETPSDQAPTSFPPPPDPAADNSELHVWLLWGGLTLVVVWTFWESLWFLTSVWQQPEYSHGYLIPLFAGGLLYLRREPFGEVSVTERLAGLSMIAVGVVGLVVSAAIILSTPENYAFLIAMLGVVVLVGGWRALRWAGPAVAYLFFMFPLPGAVARKLLDPLQTLATFCSCVVLQTLGVDAYREVNVIRLEGIDMGVVDACSGLRMLTIFIALALSIAMVLTTRPWWERLIVVVSAVPIALTVNIIRITVTGLAYNVHVDSEFVHTFAHDGAGFVMMPMALGLLYLEFQVLSRLFIERQVADVVPAMATSGHGHKRTRPGRK